MLHKVRAQGNRLPCLNLTLPIEIETDQGIALTVYH